jgi:ATP-dependent 26S proteasome regulatory subunit
MLDDELLVNLQVIDATNHADILDHALLRFACLDRKIEFPHPSEEAVTRILQVGFQNMLPNFPKFLHLFTLFVEHASTNVLFMFLCRFSHEK